MKKIKVKVNPRAITDEHIVTERHEAEAIIKMGEGWFYTGFILLKEN